MTNEHQAFFRTLHKAHRSLQAFLRLMETHQGFGLCFPCFLQTLKCKLLILAQPLLEFLASCSSYTLSRRWFLVCHKHSVLDTRLRLRDGRKERLPQQQTLHRVPLAGERFWVGTLKTHTPQSDPLGGKGRLDKVSKRFVCKQH